MDNQNQAMQIKSVKKLATVLAISISLILSACSKSRGDASGNGASPSLPSANDSQSGKQMPQATTVGLPQPDAAVPLDKYVSIESGEQLMYLYYGLSKMPPDMNEIAENISSEYRSTSDQFKRQDMLKVLSPHIQSNIAERGQSRYVIWDVEDVVLEHYDFNAKRFPIKELYWGGNNQFWWNDLSSYKIGFSAPESLRYLNISDENVAREVEGSISKFQSSRLRIYAFIQNADLNEKKLKAIITHVVLKDKSGRVLFSQ